MMEGPEVTNGRAREQRPRRENPRQTSCMASRASLFVPGKQRMVLIKNIPEHFLVCPSFYGTYTERSYLINASILQTVNNGGPSVLTGRGASESDMSPFSSEGERPDGIRLPEHTVLHRLLLRGRQDKGRERKRWRPGTQGAHCANDCSHLASAASSSS